MKVIVFDWAFSTPHHCECCGEGPQDYWQMAQIEIETKDVGKYKMIWVCMNCLGERVSTIEK